MGSRFTISDHEVEISAIRAQGSGGQNVNKVSNAVHLRFDINASSLPEHVSERLLKLGDQRISKDGVVIIKAQEFRTILSPTRNSRGSLFGYRNEMRIFLGVSVVQA